jgi:alkylation response protein AidB-like acyl-CoA dehydrogenase
LTALATDTTPIAAQIAAACGIERLRNLLPPHVDAGQPTIVAILEAAGELATAALAPLNRMADKMGCCIESGRVLTAIGHRDVWQLFTAQGWTALDQPAEFGGQDLPTVIAVACQEVFDRACPAFGMLPLAQRAAARLLLTHADAAMKAEWLPQLICGNWGATICISETGAGSDVGRIRTLATPQDDGTWSIVGEKIWISFGDHDLTERIGHCLLARTPEAPPGAAGLSLFLVPSTLVQADGTSRRNSIVVRRLEEKLGLHGSPTCALGFEGAQGKLVGALHRGLSQLFAMIATMRLGVATQGVAVAAGAAEVALAYAEERLQGGPPNAPAVPIATHRDVQRMLLGMVSRVEVVRGLVMALAVQIDLARFERDARSRLECEALSQWLLPIAKTFAGETAVQVASEAIQVLGGAGYVNDWPIAQALRDARVFTLYEGTSGIQAQDLLHRRLWRDKGRGLDAFLNMARAEVESTSRTAEANNLDVTLTLLSEAASHLAVLEKEPVRAEAVAAHFLQLSAYAATGWIGLRLASLTGGDAPTRRLVAAGRYWLSDLHYKAAFEHAQIVHESDRLRWFKDVRPAHAEFCL